MPSKYYIRNFQSGHFYHIFNRGAAKQITFPNEKDYQTFIEILKYYLLNPTGAPISYLDRLIPTSSLITSKPLKQPIILVSYCLMPNHYHLLLKQDTDNKDLSISNLLRRLSITYSMYFNKQYEKTGSVFQGKYKNVHIKTNEQLIHTSKYIHINPKSILKRFQKLETYPYSSYPNYILNNTQEPWINIKQILDLDYFNKSKNSSKSYQKFVNDSVNDSSKYVPLS